jgi:GTP cyclohydrolase II
MRKNTVIIRLAERELKTKFGKFNEVLYYDGQRESIAIVMGEVAGRDEVLCRVHSHCVGAHIFNSIECDCREQMAAAQAEIEQAGSGVVIWLDQEAKGNGHLALIQSTPYKLAGEPQALAYQKAGFRADARDYGAAGQILNDLGIKSIVLLANDPAKADDLQRYGITVTGTQLLTTADL